MSRVGTRIWLGYFLWPLAASDVIMRTADQPRQPNHARETLMRVLAALAALICGSPAALADPVLAVTRSAKSSNARIKSELGWAPRYPTAQEGVPDAIARLGQPAPAT